MPHFRFYEKGAPFPGTCVFSGDNKNLWEVGSMTVQGQILAVLLSDRVLQELATQAGYVTSRSYAELNATLSAKIAKQEAQIETTPKLLKDFQNDVTSLITEFVTSLASVDGSNHAVQLEGDQADARDAHPSNGSKSKGGKGKSEASIPGDEFTGE